MQPNVTRLFWLPFAVSLALCLWLVGAGGDFWIADRLYAWEGGRWALRNHWLTNALLHARGHDASVLAWLCAAAALLVAMLRRSLRWRRPLAYLVASVAASTGVVAALKSFSPRPCPWDLARYGGDGYRPAGHCFPAGHASAGYAWLALYFMLLVVRPAWRWHGLAVGVLLGLLFGVDQQLRGAHFMSHDVVAATICWTVALGLYTMMLRPRAIGRAT